MGLELSKELIKINQLIGEDFSQTLVDGDIIVPDIKPDIDKVLQVDGRAVINDKQVHKDRVAIEGTVNFKILYIPDGDSETIKSINASSNFNHSIELKDIIPDMNAQVESDVEHVEFEVINGRKLNVKAVVGMNCKVIESPNLELVADIKGSQEKKEDIQVLKKKVNAYNIVVEDETNLTIAENLEIPAGKPSIDDLLKVDVKISGKDMKLINDKVLVKGELNVCTLYVGDMDENTIQFMEHEVPFTEIVDFDGVKEDMCCELDYDIQDVYYQVKEDNDGDIRMLNIENTIKVSVKVSEKVSMDVVVDCYSPDENIKLEKNEYYIDEILEDSKTQNTIKETLDMPADIPNIVQVYNVITKPYITDTKVADNKVDVEGVIDTYILYLSDDEESPIYSYKQEVPFNQSIEVSGATSDMACDIKVEINHFSYSMNATSEIDVRYILGVSCKVIKTTKIELITSAEINEIDIADKEELPSIILYFVQQGDSYWEIAKRYRTTVDSIMQANNIENEAALVPGKRLLIPKRKKKEAS